MAAKVIILPRDRLAWHKQMAEDRELSHVAFRVGVCIGGAFNNRTGKTFIGYERIGALIGACRRTVFGAVKELESRGHLAVDFGGGRNVANEYRMVVKTVQPVAPFGGGETVQPVAPFGGGETVQNPAPNGAAGCTTTLKLPKKEANSPAEKSKNPRDQPRGRKADSRGSLVDVVVYSDDWRAWLSHYETNDPEVAKAMLQSAANGRWRVWAVPSQRPPANIHKFRR